MKKSAIERRAYWGRRFPNLTAREVRGLSLAMLEQLDNAKSNAARRLLVFGLDRGRRRARWENDGKKKCEFKHYN